MKSVGIENGSGGPVGFRHTPLVLVQIPDSGSTNTAGKCPDVWLKVSSGFTLTSL